MQIEIISETSSFVHKIKRYTLMYGNCQVEVEKWWREDDDSNDYNQDYKIINEEEVEEELTEDEFCSLTDFINTLQ